MEKVHDRGGRTNNKAEKNVKYRKPGDLMNSSGLDEQEESGRRRLPESSTGPATLNCRCSCAGWRGSPTLITPIALLNVTRARDNKRVCKIYGG